MNTPNGIEANLLGQCGELLQFAAENKSGLPVQVIADIEAAWDSQTQATWNPQIAAKFWSAYDGLCSHLHPVTLDTLSTAQPIPTWITRFGSTRKTTVAKFWAHLFLTILLLILAASLCLAFVATAGEILTGHDIPELMSRGDKAVSGIRDLIAQKPDEIGEETNFDQPSLKPDSRVWIAKLRQSVVELFVVSDTLYEKTNASVSTILWLGTYPLCQDNQRPSIDHCYYKGPIQQPNSLKDVLENTTNFYNFFETQSLVRTRTDKAVTRLTAIKSYLLPALLGMLGACTFVVRSISDQIKDFTFSGTSPLRHTMRVALGSIVGVVVVTFYGIPSSAQLSASAWAFIAGYSMEAVFATFEFVAGKLKS